MEEMEEIEVIKEGYQESKEFKGYEDTVLYLTNGEKIIITVGRIENLIQVGQDMVLEDLSGNAYYLNRRLEWEVFSIKDNNKLEEFYNE